MYIMIVLILQGYIWIVIVELGMLDFYNGFFVGIIIIIFDINFVEVSFYFLNLISVGVYVVKFIIVFNFVDYSLIYEELIIVKVQSYINLVIEDIKEVVVKFNEDYDFIVGIIYNKYFFVMMGNVLVVIYSDIILNIIVVFKGRFSFVDFYINFILFFSFLVRFKMVRVF